MRKNISALVLVLVAALTWAPAVSLATSFFNVDSAGNIGIGNTDPQHKLDVSGAMYSRLATTTSAVNWNAGNVQSITLSSNPTLTFSNGQAGGVYKLILKQDGTGGRTVTWPASVKWNGSVVPILTPAADAISMVGFVYDGTYYLGVSEFVVGADCLGGTISHSGGNTIHSFTSVGTSTLDCSGVGAKLADVLIVGGGGGGGAYQGAGGGGGGVLFTSGVTLTASSHAVHVGDGGVAGFITDDAESRDNGMNGGYSLLDGTIAYGGGGGATAGASGSSPAGKSGGSGGGGSSVGGTGGSGISGQGYAGGNSPGSPSPYAPTGGGGGAGAAGQTPASGSSNGGNGGNGLTYSISGTSASYGGGGGGVTNGDGAPGTGGSGGSGGGGAGAYASNDDGTSGTAHTGGGGGGGKYTSAPGHTVYGGTGGTGIVIVSYPTP